jgi:hypothetical protein
MTKRRHDQPTSRANAGAHVLGVHGSLGNSGVWSDLARITSHRGRAQARGLGGLQVVRSHALISARALACSGATSRGPGCLRSSLGVGPEDSLFMSFMSFMFKAFVSFMSFMSFMPRHGHDYHRT